MMGWAELFQVLSFLLFAAVLSVLIYKCWQIKKKLDKKNKKNIAYVRTKVKVAEYLNEKENESQISRFENIVKITKSVIIHKLMSSSTKKYGIKHEVCKDEEALKSIFGGLLKNFSGKDFKESHLIKALRFQLKSQTMKHPFDIVTSRRAFVMLEVLHGVLEKKDFGDNYQTTFPASTLSVDIGHPLSWHSSYMKLS